MCFLCVVVFFFKQKTAYEMRISDWSSDVCSSDLHGHETGLCLALAFPDRVSKRRSADGADWASVGGRGFRLDPLSPLAREEWLAVGEVQGSAAGDRKSVV